MKLLDCSESKAIQLQILDEIDAFCKAEGLRYSLAYGTLIGAIRGISRGMMTLTC